MPPKKYYSKRSTAHKKNINNNNKRTEDDPLKSQSTADNTKNPDSSSASVASTTTTTTTLQHQQNQQIAFNPYHNSFVSHFRRQLKKAVVLDESEEANRITSNDFFVANSSGTLATSTTRLEKQLQEVKDLIHVPDPEPFLVCCVVNSIHNLRVVVDPKNPTSRNINDNNKEKNSKITSKQNHKSIRKYGNDDDDDDHASSEIDDDDDEEDEFFYSEDPRVWDYSIWDCPRSVVISGKQRLYKFQQKCRERQKLWEEYREKGEALANAAAVKRSLKMLKRKKKEDKESKKKSSEKDKNNSDDDGEENDGKTKNNKFVTVSSWTSIPAPPVISAKDHAKPQQATETSAKNSTTEKHPPPKKIAISALPSCYLSTYDKDVNPLASQMAKDKNVDADEISLVYRATTGAVKTSADSANEEKNIQQKSSSSSSRNNNNNTPQHQPTKNKNENPEKTKQEKPAASLLVDRPPSRVTYDPARYAKIVAQTSFEAPHPALVDMAVIFNNKIEIACMLTAPTMYHDMPSDAESHAMHEAEAEHVRNIPSTMTVLERSLPASAIPSFPSAAKLREYAAGALRELRSMVETYDGDSVAKKSKATQQQNEVEASKGLSQKEPAQLTQKNRRKHYAGLLKLHFAPAVPTGKSKNDGDGENLSDYGDDEEQHFRRAPSAPSSSVPEYSSNSNEATAAGSMILENLHNSSLLLSKEKAFTLVHCLGPVKFLPPVDSALFVPRAPTSFSLAVCEVPDPEMHPAEKILLKYLLEFLEGDEYNGSLATTLAQNCIRDTPQFDFVIGDIHECWGDFISTHANIEFATFTYSEEDVELLGVALSKQQQQQQANNINNSKNATAADHQHQQDQNSNINNNNDKQMEHPSQNFEHMAKSFVLTKELRLVAWKNVHTFMEGDYARWATKMENERRVVDVMQSLLNVRPYEHHELIKLLGQNRAFISLASPCIRRMVDYARTDPRCVILQNRLHPLTIEIREDLVDVTKREYFQRQRRQEEEERRQRRQNGGGDNNDDDDDEMEQEEDLSTTEGKLKALSRAMDMETYD